MRPARTCSCTRRPAGLPWLGAARGSIFSHGAQLLPPPPALLPQGRPGSPCLQGQPLHLHSRAGHVGQLPCGAGLWGLLGSPWERPKGLDPPRTFLGCSLPAQAGSGAPRAVNYRVQGRALARPCPRVVRLRSGAGRALQRGARNPDHVPQDRPWGTAGQGRSCPSPRGRGEPSSRCPRDWGVGGCCRTGLALWGPGAREPEPQPGSALLCLWWSRCGNPTGQQVKGCQGLWVSLGSLSAVP